MCQELMQGQNVNQRGERSGPGAKCKELKAQGGQRPRCGQDGASATVLSSKKTSLLAVLAPCCAFGGEALHWPC